MDERYLRQVNIQEIGDAGQKKLASSAVLVVGAGGLGSALLYCLAGAGVGRIGISEFDVLSRHNLNRQFLYRDEDVGKEKIDLAINALAAFNPTLKYEKQPQITEANASEIVSKYDAVVGAVDSIRARLLLNRACVEKNVTLINGSVEGMNGLVNSVHPGKTACLDCIYSDAKDGLTTPTSFAPVVTAISSVMAQETLLILLGQDDPLFGSMLHFDGVLMQFNKIPVERAPGCGVCGKK